MLVAKVTCVWLSPSVSVHVLEEPAGFKYDVCAGMLTLSSTIQTCVAVKKKKKKGKWITSDLVCHAEQRVSAGDLSVSTCPHTCCWDEWYWCPGSQRRNLSSLISLLRASGGNQVNCERDSLLDCRTQHVLLLFMCVRKRRRQSSTSVAQLMNIFFTHRLLDMTTVCRFLFFSGRK